MVFTFANLHGKYRYSSKGLQNSSSSNDTQLTISAVNSFEKESLTHCEHFWSEIFSDKTRQTIKSRQNMNAVQQTTKNDTYQ